MRPHFNLSLKGKILLRFLLVIFISFALYGTLIYFVYKFNLRGEHYFRALRDHPGLEQAIIDRIRELERMGPKRFAPPITILPSGLFTRVFFSITGGVLAIVIVAASGGFLFLKRMLNQIDLITKNVKEIDEKRLHLRLNLKGKDPISNMAKTFDNMLDKLEASFKNQKQLIQNVSHELNTPLAVIKTKIDVLRQKKTATRKEYEETLEIINDEIMRLSKITEELLVLSQLEENGNKDGFVVIDLKGVLNKMLKLFEARIAAKNLHLETFLCEKSQVSGINTQIEQLLFNLLDNAVKYSDSGGELIIRLKNDSEGKNVILSLTNTAKSIKKDDLSNIFERFYKASNSQKEKGFGLGLSIAKKIVENHSGKIEASYDEDKKAVTFKIVFPLVNKT